MRSSATLAQCFTSSFTLIWFTTLPSTRFSSAQHRCCGEMRYMVVHRQPESSSVMTRFVRIVLRQPVDQVNFGADGELRSRRRVLHDVLMMWSVEPMPSAFWQTSQRHSGWTMTWMPG